MMFLHEYSVLFLTFCSVLVQIHGFARLMHHHDVTKQQRRVKVLNAHEECQYSLLDNIIIAQGKIGAGYGRGSRKLGFPTANLAEFDSPISTYGIANGVYFGWISIEGDADGNIQPCIANIGRSPTFVGEENRVNIIEAHVIDRSSQFEDFYDRIVRLVLVAFLRDEKKFSGIEELIAQITKDVNVARAACSAALDADKVDDPLSSLYYLIVPTFLNSEVSNQRNLLDKCASVSYINKPSLDQESTALIWKTYKDDDAPIFLGCCSRSSLLGSATA